MLDCHQQQAATKMHARSRGHGNEALLVDDHMMELEKRQPIRSALRQLCDDLQAHVGRLKSLGVSEDSFLALLRPPILGLIPGDLVLTFNRNVVRDKEKCCVDIQKEHWAGKENEQAREQQLPKQLPALPPFLRTKVESRE